jgi:hypothetical protein
MREEREDEEIILHTSGSSSLFVYSAFVYRSLADTQLVEARPCVSAEATWPVLLEEPTRSQRLLLLKHPLPSVVSSDAVHGADACEPVEGIAGVIEGSRTAKLSPPRPPSLHSHTRARSNACRLLLHGILGAVAPAEAHGTCRRCHAWHTSRCCCPPTSCALHAWHTWLLLPTHIMRAAHPPLCPRAATRDERLCVKDRDPPHEPLP